MTSNGHPADTPAPHVLLVDDDPAEVTLVADAFAARRLPGHLHAVDGGARALAFLRRRDGYADAPRPDLVLLDLHMPGIDGRKVLTEIKTDPGLRSIPVVVFTTSNRPEDVLDCYHSHANAYVTKPAGLDEFAAVVAGIHHFYVTLAARPAAAMRDIREPRTGGSTAA